MRSLLVIFFSFAFLGSYAQNSENKITWQEGSRLIWADFIMEPIPNSPYHANTNTGISYSWGIKSAAEGVVELNYEVLSNFFPESSWVNPKSKNDHLLAHEQLHFDISELHARKLRQKLENLSVDKLGKNAGNILNRLYEDIDKERGAMQRLYDKETRHSLDKEAEARWQEFVGLELKKLRKYRN